MLVLTREVHQKIYIGDDIVVTLTRIGRKQCWLGIEAPKGVPIHREEIHDANQAVHDAAALPVPVPEGA